MRPIDGDELIKRIRYTCSLGGWVGETLEQIKKIAIKYIDSAPTIEAPAWILCSERLPKPEEKVWIQTKRGEVCFAMYEDGTISEEDSDFCWYDLDYEKWDEENDCGIIPEGWWEWTEFNPDYMFSGLVDGEVVAWMPLPKLYKEKEQDGRTNL